MFFSHSSRYKVEFPVLESSLLLVIRFISVYMVQLSRPYMTTEKTVRMWEFDHKEGWVLKNWCFWIVVGAGEDSGASLGLQEDQTSPS